MNTQKGFTLIEMLISTSLILIIMLGVFMMVDFHINLSKTQHARLRMQQESRFLLGHFASDIKDAGSIITLSHTAGFLGSPPDFNGIYPLNNTDYPDGLILAAADPEAVTALTQAYNGGTTLNVKDTTISYPGQPWANGDKGIVMDVQGYYIFEVLNVTPISLVVQSTPVYFSGMMNITQTTSGKTVNYVDASTPKGNSFTYPVNAPVMRLTSFSIYLVDERYDYTLKRAVREMVRVTNANGDATGNFLSPASPALKGVIAENIWDVQITYSCFPDFPADTPRNDYFTAAGSSVLADLMADIQIRSLKEIRVSVVALTGEHAGKGGFANRVPDVADHPAHNLPWGKYNFKLFTMAIEPRNFNISF